MTFQGSVAAFARMRVNREPAFLRMRLQTHSVPEKATSPNARQSLEGYCHPLALKEKCRMQKKRILIDWQPLLVLGLLGLDASPVAHAYIAQPPTTLGHLATWSDLAVLARVEKVDYEKKIITYRKVRDLKGTWPSDVILHKIDPKPGDSKRAPPLDAHELRHIFTWAKEGKHAVLFAEKTRAMAHTYVDQCWYSSTYTGARGGPNAAWNTCYAIASARS